MKPTPFLALLALTVSALADPQLSSWVTDFASKYARIYTSDASKVAGVTATTWTSRTGQITQSQPAYAGMQKITYSANWIYFTTSDLGPYTMGPWYDDAARTIQFINLPKNQNINYRIPRTSTLPAPPATKTGTMGMEDAIGYFVDGVALFDPTDGWSYSGGTEASPGTGQWHRDAYVNEGITFDPGNSHQQNTGKYHNHANPLAVRYLVGDHVDFNPTTKAYSESTATPSQHSPILGWMRDGYPIYGPYGYSDPLDANSGIRRMTGGFVKRDGATVGVDNIATTGRTALPVWATRNNGNIAAAGPNVSTTYPFGRYIEDNAYLGDLIKTGATHYAQGVDFDLNEYNVRFCVTPEFPAGTYAYFLSISATGVPTFPYNTNRYFFGSPTGGTSTASETVTPFFTGGASTQEVGKSVGVNSGNGNVTFTWSSVEGGTYKVETTSDLAGAWTTLSTTQAAAANAIETSYLEAGAALTNDKRFYRTTRTFTAAYDGGGGGTGAPTVVTGAATNISATGATLNGTVTANNISTTTSFDYGLTTGYGGTASAATVTGGTATAVSAAITGLTANATYHFRAKGVNTAGTVYGSDATFTAIATGSTEGISTVSPTSGARGANGLVMTITLNSAFSPAPPPVTVQPTSVNLTRTGATTIGATSFSRNTTTGVVTATFNIPTGATVGAYTVNATFGPNTWSLTNGFTVN